jgi:hypothetical protein
MDIVKRISLTSNGVTIEKLNRNADHRVHMYLQPSKVDIETVMLRFLAIFSQFDS